MITKQTVARLLKPLDYTGLSNKHKSKNKDLLTNFINQRENMTVTEQLKLVTNVHFQAINSGLIKKTQSGQVEHYY